MLVGDANAGIIDPVEVRCVHELAHAQARHHAIETVVAIEVLRRTVCAT